MICGTNKLLAILEAADEMNMMKKALPFCKQMGSAFLMQRRKGLWCSVGIYRVRYTGRPAFIV